MKDILLNIYNANGYTLTCGRNSAVECQLPKPITTKNTNLSSISTYIKQRFCKIIKLVRNSTDNIRTQCQCSLTFSLTFFYWKTLESIKTLYVKYN
jgi:hypothetical protein